MHPSSRTSGRTSARRATYEHTSAACPPAPITTTPVTSVLRRRGDVPHSLQQIDQLPVTLRANLCELLQPLRIAIEHRLGIGHETGDDGVGHLVGANLDGHPSPEAFSQHPAVRDSIVPAIDVRRWNVGDLQTRILCLEDLHQVDNPEVLV